MPVKFYVVWEYYNYETEVVSYKMEQAEDHDSALDKYFSFLNTYVAYGTVGRATAMIIDSNGNEFEKYVWVKETTTTES